MSKKASPTVIGGFVLGAVFLLVAATMIFGGAQFFETQSRSVAYFPGSVKGLRTGANVLFRGVRVGFVEDIQLQGDADTAETLVMVVMRIFPEQYHLTRDGIPLSERERPQNVSAQVDLIEAGFRAQLGVESFVTGQLVVEFDFFPDTPIVYRGSNPPYPETPTIPNDIEEIVEGVQRFVADIQANLDVEQLTRDLQATASGLRRLVDSEDLRQAVAGFNNLMNADATQALPGDLEKTLADARAAIVSVRRLSDGANERLGPLLDEFTPVIARLDGTLAAAQNTLESAGRQMQGDTELAHQLTSTLAEVEAASRSLRTFVDLLERNPEALLRGKRQR
jgi:paraquat-inducible protein B